MSEISYEKGISGSQELDFSFAARDTVSFIISR